MFKLSEKSENGGYLQLHVTAGFNKLVEILGEPNSEGDNYKVSTMWLVEDENGSVCTIYDYKETNLYDNDQISVDEFRNQPEYKWHIGGNDQVIAEKLRTYIMSK